MKRYLNLKTNYGVETVDQINSNDFETLKAFRIELKRLISENHSAGLLVYVSQKADQSWKKK
jgi:hypothetical protein